MNANAPITESIDERILKLLGLEETFDLDYGTYTQTLKERLLRVTAFGEKISSKDFTLLKDELKRVKTKKKEKKIRIQPERLVNKKPTPKTAKVSAKKLLPVRGATLVKKQVKDDNATVKKSNIVKSSNNVLVRIDKSLESIFQTLTSLNKLQEKKFQTDRKEKENKKREEKESGLEKGRKLITGAVKKMLAPFQNIFDRILNFIFFTLLGRAFTMLMNWLGDPKNKKKVQTLGRFLKDWWPALLGAVSLFMTPFGGFVKGIVTIVAAFSGKVLKLIPALIGIVKGLGKGALGVGRFAATNPLASAITLGAVAAGGGAYIASQQNEQRRREIDPNAVTPGQTKNQGKTPGASQLMREQILQRGIGGFSRGARIEGGYNGVDKNTGIPITGAGRDTQLIAARAGEIVLTPEDRTDIYNKTGYDIADQVKNRKPNFVDSGKVKLFGNTPLMSLGGILGFSKGGMVGNPIAAQEAWSNYMKLNPEKFRKGSMYGDIDSINKASRDFMKTFMKTGKPPEWAKFVRDVENVKASASATKTSAPLSRRTTSALSTNVRTSGQRIPQIRTNMKVPGGFGNLKSFGAELILNYLLQSGLDYVEAKRLASTIEKARKESPEKLAARIEKLRELVDNEERYQKSFRGILDKVIKLGGETGSERLSRQARTILGGLGAKTYQGGATKGGYGLKDQSFEDAPKTQIMTDDKGRPFVGYKAKRAGKLVYVRGPKPGEGTSNPLEALGRMINPNAYRANDELLGRQKYKEGLANSLQSLQARGASTETQKKMMKKLGGNLKDAQRDLMYKNRVKPKSYVPSGGGMGGRRGSGKVKKRQGGGGIEGGVSPAEIQRAYINARKNKTLPPELLLELGREASDAMYGPAATQGGSNWRSNKSSGVTDYYGNPKPLRKFGGGFLDITSNFGINTSMFGADTQFSPLLNTALQKGESLFDFDYVLTRDAMMNGAREQLVAFAEKLNSLDPDSNARKQGILPAKVNQPNITPYSAESVASMITMPPMRQSAEGMRSPASPTGPAVFSPIPNDAVALATRKSFADMYGIVG